MEAEKHRQAGGDSDEARAKGNAHFMKKQFPQALAAYHIAADLDSADYRPLWNISAVQYEMGNYDLASEYSQKALELVPSNDDVAAQKVLIRLAKAHLHLKQYKESAQYIERLTAGPDKKQLQSALGTVVEAANVRNRGRTASVRHLAQFKPQVDNIPEFYNVGHDISFPMFDPLLQRHSSHNETIAFLFAGIGDARHFFQTCIAIAHFETVQPSHRRYHFTINDIKREVFARDLIFFLLIAQIAPEVGIDEKGEIGVSEKGEMALATLFYSYVAQVMPPSVYIYLQATIDSAIRGIKGQQSLPHWIRFAEKDSSAILAALRSWQSEVIKEYPVKEFIQNTLRGHVQSQAILTSYGMSLAEMDGCIPAGCKAEFLDYFESAMLLPPQSIIEPALQQILNIPPSKKRTKRLCKHIETAWKPNVTLVDLPYLREGVNLLDVGHNPAELARHLHDGSVLEKPKDPKKLYDYAKPFFLMAANALRWMDGRVVVEALSGDVTQLLEKLQYDGCQERPPNYPTRYDRIHLSNIP